MLWDAKRLLFLSKGEFRVNLHQVRGRDSRCPTSPVCYVESDVDVNMGTGGDGADDLWAGGLRGGLRGDLCGDAELGADGLCVGE